MEGGLKGCIGQGPVPPPLIELGIAKGAGGHKGQRPKALIEPQGALLRGQHKALLHQGLQPLVKKLVNAPLLTLAKLVVQIPLVAPQVAPQLEGDHGHEPGQQHHGVGLTWVGLPGLAIAPRQHSEGITQRLPALVKPLNQPWGRHPFDGIEPWVQGRERREVVGVQLPEPLGPTPAGLASHHHLGTTVGSVGWSRRPSPQAALVLGIAPNHQPIF